MKSIKIYLLPLSFILFFSGTIFSQNDSYIDNSEEAVEEKKLSETDSILVNTYFTEEDYNVLNKIEQSESIETSKSYYGDEIYNDDVKRRRGKNSFLEGVAVEVAIEVVFNTLFILATFWQ